MKKNILIELSDEELKLLSQKEYEELIKSDEEFDGFHGWTLRGVIRPPGGEVVSQAETMIQLKLKGSEVRRLGNAIERILEPNAKYDPDMTEQLRNMIDVMVKNAYIVEEILKKILDKPTDR